MKAYQHKLNLKRTAVLLFGIMMSCATVKAQDTPCLPSHGETNNQPAWCGIEQVIALVEGINWVSFYVDITMDDLKAALEEALPGTTIKISSRTQTTTYNGSRWRGQLNTLDVTLMYKIEVTANCEITLEGMPINPAEHPVTVEPGINWIAFPFTTSMPVAEAFAGFAVSGDKLNSRTLSTSYIGTRWRGQLDTLEPGQGYIYNSAAAESRTLVFPTRGKKF